MSSTKGAGRPLTEAVDMEWLWVLLLGIGQTMPREETWMARDVDKRWPLLRRRLAYLPSYCLLNCYRPFGKFYCCTKIGAQLELTAGIALASHQDTPCK